MNGIFGNGVMSDHEIGHDLDNGFGGETGLRPHRYRLPPADRAVRLDPRQAQVAEGVEIVRLRVADRYRFDLGDLQDDLPVTLTCQREYSLPSNALQDVGVRGEQGAVT